MFGSGVWRRVWVKMFGGGLSGGVGWECSPFLQN